MKSRELRSIACLCFYMSMAHSSRCSCNLRTRPSQIVSMVTQVRFEFDRRRVQHNQIYYRNLAIKTQQLLKPLSPSLEKLTRCITHCITLPS